MRGGAVYGFSPEGDVRHTIAVGRPGGLGWTPDGRLLVVSMDAKKLLRFAPDGTTVEAELDFGGLFGDTHGFLNDLVTGPRGDAYVGFDADYHLYGGDADLGMIVHLPPRGEARIVARDIAFPNGLMITPDGETLVVAETMKPRLSAYDIAPDGTLGLRRTWASLDPKRDERVDRTLPLGDRLVSLDGCSIDAESHVWGADVASACLRIAPGGAIVDAIFLPDDLLSFACMLGGPDGRTLMICAADGNFADRTSRRESRLFTTRVDVPASPAAKGFGRNAQ
jgi:sugar lactone lactonase YvrE